MILKFVESHTATLEPTLTSTSRENDAPIGVASNVSVGGYRKCKYWQGERKAFGKWPVGVVDMALAFIQNPGFI
jgi:hypothetical protein